MLNLALIFGFTLGTPALGQPKPGDDIVALVEVIRSLRAVLPPGPVALDPRVYTTSDYWKNPRAATHRIDRIAALRAEVPRSVSKRMEEVIICEPEPGPCVFQGAETVLAFSNVSIAGDTARVRLHWWFATVDRGGKKDVGIRDVVFVLVRVTNGWKVLPSRQEIRIS